MYGTFLLLVPVSLSKAPIIITIPQGSSTSSIAEELKSKNIIRSKGMFKLYAKVLATDKKLRAGMFELKRSDSTLRIVTALGTQTGYTNLVRVTIPEGWTINKIDKALSKSNITEENAFKTYIHTKAKADFITKYPFLEDAPTKNLEGYLYPDTYYFSKGQSPNSITNMILHQFNTQIMTQWNAANEEKGSPKSRFTFHEVLTLASIIQKEARHIEEMPVISSVFNNRLKKMMPLGADPTVVYAMGLERKDIVTYKDTKTISPYNTYQVSGFPPTPIASPGKDAFLAALNPADTDYYFFVANPDGSHSFTRTYKDHLKIQRVKNRKGKYIDPQ